LSKKPKIKRNLFSKIFDIVVASVFLVIAVPISLAIVLAIITIVLGTLLFIVVPFAIVMFMLSSGESANQIRKFTLKDERKTAKELSDSFATDPHAPSPQPLIISIDRFSSLEID
jgi:predicted membrane protein